jgi:hypothetical protein
MSRWVGSSGANPRHFFPVALFNFAKFMLVIIAASITFLPPEWENANSLVV